MSNIFVLKGKSVNVYVPARYRESRRHFHAGVLSQRECLLLPSSRRVIRLVRALLSITFLLCMSKSGNEISLCASFQAAFNQQIAQYRGKVPEQQLTDLAVAHFEDALNKCQQQVRSLVNFHEP